MRYSCKFLLVLLLCCSAIAGWCQNKAELVKKLQLKKSTLTKPSHPAASKEEVYFDTNGNDSLKLLDGKKNRTWQYSYDAQHRLLQRKEFTGDGKLWIEDSYTYNTDGSFKKEK